MGIMMMKEETYGAPQLRPDDASTHAKFTVIQ